MESHATPLLLPPALGRASGFAVLGAETVTSTGRTRIHGLLGVFPGSAITGFPPGVLDGTQHAADAVASGAHHDAGVAYDAVAAALPTAEMGTDKKLGGKTLVPGVYHFASSAQITGFLILDGRGDPNAVFLFQIGSTLTTASDSGVLLINGASPARVFWQVGSSATLGTRSRLVGTLLAHASITVTTEAEVSGRLVARSGAVTLDTATVAVPTTRVSS